MTDKITTVLWDVDGTLLDFIAAEKAAIRDVYKRQHPRCISVLHSSVSGILPEKRTRRSPVLHKFPPDKSEPHPVQLTHFALFLHNFVIFVHKNLHLAVSTDGGRSYKQKNRLQVRNFFRRR